MLQVGSFRKSPTYRRAGRFPQRRPMYTVGQAIEYYSSSYQAWLPGLIEKCDPATGAVQVDNKPGWWLKGLDLKKVRPKKKAAGGSVEDAEKAAVGRQAFIA